MVEPQARNLTGAGIVVAAFLLAAAAGARAQDRRAEIERRLETQRVPPIEFSNSTLEEIAQIMTDLTGITFVVHPDCGEIPPVALRFDGVPVKSVLRYLLERHGLMYFIREDYVEIAPKTHEPTYIVVYDVRDLVSGITDFVPDVDPDTFWNPLAPPAPPAAANEQPAGALDLGQIKDLILSQTGGDSWETHPRVGITEYGDAHLVIRQTAATHRQIERLLDLLR